MAQIFLSYKREDRPRVAKIVAALTHHGFEVWWDQLIPPDAPWEATIKANLETADIVLVCWSEQSADSENVNAEARWAKAKGRLLQVFIEPCEPPLFFGERQGVSLVDWNGLASAEPIMALATAIRRQLTGDQQHTGVTFTRFRTLGARAGRAKLQWVAAGGAVALAVIATIVSNGQWSGPAHRASSTPSQPANAYQALPPSPFVVGSTWGRLTLDQNCQLKFGNALVHSFEYVGEGNGSNPPCEYSVSISPSPSGARILIMSPVNDYGSHALASIATGTGQIERASATFEGVELLEARDVWSPDERYSLIGSNVIGGPSVRTDFGEEYQVMASMPCVYDSVEQSLGCESQSEFIEAALRAVRSHSTEAQCLVNRTCQLELRYDSGVWVDGGFEARFRVDAFRAMGGETVAVVEASGAARFETDGSLRSLTLT